MPMTIRTSNGTIRITRIVVADTATLIVPASDNPRDWTIINAGALVLDVGDATVAPGTGMPLQPNGDSVDGGGGDFTTPFQPHDGVYGAYPGGGGDVCLVERV